MSGVGEQRSHRVFVDVIGPQRCHPRDMTCPEMIYCIYLHISDGEMW